MAIHALSCRIAAAALPSLFGSKAPSAEHLSFGAEKRQRCSWCGQSPEDCTCSPPTSSCETCRAYQSCQGVRTCPACDENVRGGGLVPPSASEEAQLAWAMAESKKAYDVKVQELETVVERVEEVEEDEDKAAQRLVQCHDGGTVKLISVDSAQECCIICMVNQANVVLMPCGHCHLCTHCLERFVGEGKSNITCPTCRQLVSSAHELVPLTQHALQRPILDMILQREQRRSSMKGGSNGTAFYRWTHRKSALKSALKGGGYAPSCSNHLAATHTTALKSALKGGEYVPNS